MAPSKIPDTVAHYDVRQGDSLWAISIHRLGDARFFSDLAKLNGLSPKALLQIGQRLIVPDYRRYDLTAAYMLSQMVNNASGPEARAIANAITRSKQFQTEGDRALEDMKKAKWYELFRAYGDQQIFNATVQQSGIAIAEAKARWFLQVRQDGPWDHKPVLRKMYGSMSAPPRPFGTLGRAFHFPIRGDLFHEFFYDIWSNIHYGYVGVRCGFDEQTLQEGAASGFPGAGGNDQGDVISVKIGIDLWRSFGATLSMDQLRRAILAQTANYQAARTREISQGIKEADATNVVITNNDYK